MRAAALVSALVGLVAAAGADVRLPGVFGDSMVLQRDAQARLWGWADPGERVRVSASWGGPAVEVLTPAGGMWSLTLPTPPAGGPHTLTVEGKNSLTLKDVLSGDVWLCSGQSNMEWTLNQTHDAREAIAGATQANIRLFTVANRFALAPEGDVRGAWSVCSPETAAGFSAVGYHFGREIHAAEGVPIGLISADWGGTVCEAWMSEAGARAFGAFEDALTTISSLRADPAAARAGHEERQREWWASAPLGDASWIAPEFDDGAWSGAAQPASFGGALGSFDGMVCLRRAVEVPAAWAGRDLTLSLGPIDDRDAAWFNGVWVGATTEDGRWGQNRSYKVPGALVKAGRNVIAVNVYDTGGIGGMNGDAALLKLTLAGDPSAAVSLAGEWKQRAGRAAGNLPPVPQGITFHQNWPTALYNGMIAPIANLSIRGAIWYQGESNVSRAEQYRTLFPAMIEDWRRTFRNPGLPFYFVQIAPFAYGGDTGQAAMLREAQGKALALPHTGMAVTLDIGEAKDIHPRNKREVGRRLALLALADTYGRSVNARGPALASVKREGGAIRVGFTVPAGDALAAEGHLRGFAIAGEDKVFHPAKAAVDGASVVVQSESVPDPRHVRYAWSAAPEANLRSASGLPAAPFRTDSWDEATMLPADEVAQYRADEPGFAELFNGRDLAGWVNINCDDSTWTVRDGMIVCSGVPTGLLRTEKRYENYILELEFRHMKAGGNAGLFVWSDPITARGQPFSRSVEVQVMDGLEGDWFTSDGDIFPIHGAVMTPENGRGGQRAFPTEKRMNAAPEWNHYRVTCLDGSISLAVNGKVVTRGHAASPREGFICLESEGSEVHFRNIRIKELVPSRTPPTGKDRASDDLGFVPLYGGVDFEGWKFGEEHEGHWRAADWTIAFDGQGADLWTEKSYRDFVLIADWRWTAKPTPTERPVILPDGSVKKDDQGQDVMVTVDDAGDSGIYLRGSSKSQVNMWCWPIGSGEVYGYRTDGSMPPEVRAGVTPTSVADAPIGQWNRFVITMKGEYLSVVLNGVTVIENAHLPGVAPEGPIALQMHGNPIEFANLLIREIKE